MSTTPALPSPDTHPSPQSAELHSPALFHAVATLADTLAPEASRLKKRSAIAEALGATAADSSPAEAGLFALYLSGLPFPEADPRKLNAGGAILTRAILTVSGSTQPALTQAYRRHGDLGAAAFDLLSAPSFAPHLTLNAVAESFAAIAIAKTTAIRSATLEALLRDATPVEVKYLVKLMLGDMRIGVKQALVEEAIAVAASKARQEDVETDVVRVRHAVMLEADLAQAVVRAFAGTLDEARMRLFHPLGFMLASPVETPEEAVDRFTAKPAKPEKPVKAKKKKAADPEALMPVADPEAAPESEPQPPSGPILAFLEDKYDGMRAQVHCGDSAFPGRVAIYSRNREDITGSFPEIAEAFANVKPDVDGALILDGEILAWDFGPPDAVSAPSAKAPSLLTPLPAVAEPVIPHALPFAILGTRIGRRKVTDDLRRQVPVVFMVFDLMFHRDRLVLDLPLRDRRNLLESVVEQMVDRIVAPFPAPSVAKGPQEILFKGTAGAGVSRLMISPSRLVDSAEDIDRAYADARARSNEGVMLKEQPPRPIFLAVAGSPG